MKVYYGIDTLKINVTAHALKYCIVGNILFIDVEGRDKLFGDPLIGVHKNIYIYDMDPINPTVVDDITPVLYNLETHTLHSTPTNDKVSRLDAIHKNITLHYGTFNEEYPEQLMVVDFLTGSEKVLELGSNIGRNSLIIGSVLKDSKNLVTLECDSTIAAQLKHNRDANSLEFHIENSALSMRGLVQRGWETLPSDIPLEGYTPVNTITYDELVAKYSMNFDTLVADCEGALYYILKDMPSMLTSISLVIMENDYFDLTHKEFVDSVLVSYGFERVYNETGGWGPCYDRFYEVWRKA